MATQLISTVCFILAMFASYVTAFFGWNSCPDFQRKISPDLDLEKFSGIWYEYAKRGPDLYETGLKCLYSNYIPINDTAMTVNIVGQYQSNGTEKNVKTVASIDDISLRRKLRIEFPNASWVPQPMPYLFLATDYDNFAVICTCYHVRYFNIEYAWVLTRKKNVTNSQQDNFTKDHIWLEVQNFGLKPSSFSYVDQSTCTIETPVDSKTETNVFSSTTTTTTTPTTTTITTTANITNTTKVSDNTRTSDLPHLKVFKRSVDSVIDGIKLASPGNGNSSATTSDPSESNPSAEFGTSQTNSINSNGPEQLPNSNYTSSAPLQNADFSDTTAPNDLDSSPTSETTLKLTTVVSQTVTSNNFETVRTSQTSSEATFTPRTTTEDSLDTSSTSLKTNFVSQTVTANNSNISLSSETSLETTTISETTVPENFDNSASTDANKNKSPPVVVSRTTDSLEQIVSTTTTENESPRSVLEDLSSTVTSQSVEPTSKVSSTTRCNCVRCKCVRSREIYPPGAPTIAIESSESSESDEESETSKFSTNITSSLPASSYLVFSESSTTHNAVDNNSTVRGNGSFVAEHLTSVFESTKNVSLEAFEASEYLAGSVLNTSKYVGKELINGGKYIGSEVYNGTAQLPWLLGSAFNTSKYVGSEVINGGVYIGSRVYNTSAEIPWLLADNVIVGTVYNISKSVGGTVMDGLSYLKSYF